MTDDAGSLRGRPLVLSLPITDRPRAHAFYVALGLEAVGELADDGVPEPLQLRVNEGLSLMLIPTGGFGWVIGDHEVASPGTSECALTLDAADRADVDAVVRRAVDAGAQIVAEAADQPWGYSASFADPDGHLWLVSVGLG